MSIIGKPASLQGLDLTAKQFLFLKEYFKTGNGVQSALKVYDTDNYTSASVIAVENLQKLREPVKTYLEANGISLGTLVDVLREGLVANKVVSARVIVNKDKPISQAEGELSSADSQTDDFIEVPDHLVRHKYLETASKWLGIDKPSGTQVNVGVNVPITIGEEVSDDQLIRRVVGIIEKVKSREEEGNTAGSGGSGEAIVDEGHPES